MPQCVMHKAHYKDNVLMTTTTQLTLLERSLVADGDSDNADLDSANLYEILGVSITATAAEITKAYRKLAQKCHPDKAASEGAKRTYDAAFSKVSRAYKILKDKESRSFYDATGMEPLTDKAMLDRATNVAMEVLTKLCEELSNASDDQIRFVDPLVLAKRATAQSVSSLKAEVTSCAKKLSGYLAIQKRFRKKTKDFDSQIFGILLTQTVSSLLKRKHLLELDMKLYALADTVLDNYGYEKDEKPVSATTSIYTSVSSASTGVNWRSF